MKHAKHASEALQKPVRHVPKPSKSRPGAPLDAKMWPRSATDQPRDGQQGPRHAQETPQKRPRGARSHPKAPKSQPSNAQEPPKTVPGESHDEFLARSWWEALFNWLLHRFCVLFCLCTNFTMCKKQRKTLEKLWFLHIQSFC